MVKAYYKNSRGEVLWLTKAPFRTVEADWFDSTWEEKDGGYEKTITIDVFGKRSEFIQNMERLYKVISVDSETGNYGRLYVNDTFLPYLLNGKWTSAYPYTDGKKLSASWFDSYVIKACITSGIQMQECIVNTVSKWTTAIETAITSYSIAAQNGNFASGTVYIIGR